MEYPSIQILEKQFDDQPFRYPLFNHMLKLFFQDRREHYAWGAICATDLAYQLSLDRISFAEFGVASGNGLIELEKIAFVLEEIYGIQIDVHGFDMGVGLPEIAGYRDLPNLWSKGYFPMDEQKLRSQLKKAELHLGNVSDTIPAFLDSSPSPVAFVAHDLDLYSSTIDAFKLFEDKEDYLLPRVHIYFDDIIGFTYSKFNGERLAIEEFNARNEKRKIDQIYRLSFFLGKRTFWDESIYLLHIFDHALYAKNDGLLQISVIQNNNCPLD